MIRTPLSLSVKQTCTMIKKGTITFDSPIQRPPGQWNQQKKSDLIETIFRRFIPDFYATKIRGEKVNTYDIIDGLQRFTAICSFLNDEWELTEVKPVTLELTGEVFNISGMKFSQLPEGVQDVIKSHILTIRTIEFEEDEDEESLVEEIFYYLNSGVPMAKEHLALISAPKNVQEFCHRIATEHDLFVSIAKYSDSSIKKSDKQMTIMQSVALIAGLAYESFAAKHIEEVFAKCEITNEVLEQTEKAFTAIADTFQNTHKFVAKINIPIMTYMFAQVAEGEKELVVSNLLKYVNEDMKAGDKYKINTGTGSVKKEKVMNRINAMLDICGVVPKVKQEVKPTFEDIQSVLNEFKNDDTVINNDNVSDTVETDIQSNQEVINESTDTTNDAETILPESADNTEENAQDDGIEVKEFTIDDIPDTNDELEDTQEDNQDQEQAS